MHTTDHILIHVQALLGVHIKPQGLQLDLTNTEAVAGVAGKHCLSRGGMDHMLLLTSRAQSSELGCTWVGKILCVCAYPAYTDRYKQSGSIVFALFALLQSICAW